MNRRHWLALLMTMLIPAVVEGQVGDAIETGKTCSYFGESVPAKVTTFSSDAEADAVVKQIIAASGLSPNFEIMAAGVPNAAAIIRGSKRLILYDQYFVRSLRDRAGTRWAPISVMAHEIGHHLNGHTLENSGSRPKIELEADYYSGFVLQRMGATMAEARAAMEKFGDPTGSATHPAKYDRLAAIANGWTKSCESDPKCGQPDSSSDVRPTPSRPDPEPEPEPKPRSSRRRGKDSCEYANDGTCDEPDLCDRGTDTSDCEFEDDEDFDDEPDRGTRGPLFCCDGYGRRWCQIVANPGPLGSPCWCAGVPGSGMICR